MIKYKIIFHNDRDIPKISVYRFQIDWKACFLHAQKLCRKKVYALKTRFHQMINQIFKIHDFNSCIPEVTYLIERGHQYFLSLGWMARDLPVYLASKILSSSQIVRLTLV